MLPENWEQKIYFTDEYMEGGYASYSEAVAQIIRKVYDREGIPLDMTYTGKAFYGMMEYLKKQKITGKIFYFSIQEVFRYSLIFWRMINRNEETDDSWSKLFSASPV